jgi:chromosomal replication initiation ATPase DnaA
MKTPQNVRNAIKAGKNMKFVGGRFKTVTPKAKTPTPKAKTFVNKFVNALDKDELNALKKKIC